MIQSKEMHTGQIPPKAVTPPMLVNEISHLFFDKMRATEPPGGSLSSHGCRMLLRALTDADGGMTQGELCRATHLKAPTVSAALCEMENEGLITRIPDEKDKRATRVSPTDAGRAANEEIRARLRAVDAILTKGLSEEENALLISLLTRMRDNILLDLEQTKGGAPK